MVEVSVMVGELLSERYEWKCSLWRKFYDDEMLYGEDSLRCVQGMFNG